MNGFRHYSEVYAKIHKQTKHVVSKTEVKWINDQLIRKEVTFIKHLCFEIRTDLRESQENNSFLNDLVTYSWKSKHVNHILDNNWLCKMQLITLLMHLINLWVLLCIFLKPNLITCLWNDCLHWLSLCDLWPWCLHLPGLSPSLTSEPLCLSLHLYFQLLVLVEREPTLINEKS